MGIKITVAQALASLYPHLNAARDYTVGNPAGDDKLELMGWDEQRLGPRPTAAAIAAEIARLEAARKPD